MILTDIELQESLNKGEIEITPYDPTCMEPASYDLQIGKYGITALIKEKRDIESTGFIEIAPGDFAIIITKETIYLNLQHTARFGLRSRYARLGLIATMGPQIDPGFRGKLKIGLLNVSNKAVSLPYGEHFISVEFHRLNHPASRAYSGPYQNQQDLTADDFAQILMQGKNAFHETFDNIKELSKYVTDLGTGLGLLTNHINKVEERLSKETLSNIVPWILTIIVSISLGISLTILAIWL